MSFLHIPIRKGREIKKKSSHTTFPAGELVNQAEVKKYSEVHQVVTHNAFFIASKVNHIVDGKQYNKGQIKQ